MNNFQRQLYELERNLYFWAITDTSLNYIDDKVYQPYLIIKENTVEIYHDNEFDILLALYHITDGRVERFFSNKKNSKWMTMDHSNIIWAGEMIEYIRECGNKTLEEIESRTRIDE